MSQNLTTNRSLYSLQWSQCLKQYGTYHTKTSTQLVVVVFKLLIAWNKHLQFTNRTPMKQLDLELRLMNSRWAAKLRWDVIKSFSVNRIRAPDLLLLAVQGYPTFNCVVCKTPSYLFCPEENIEADYVSPPPWKKH